jgi:hypothetical protein
LPALSFMGHWPEDFGIPGTAYYVGLPFTGSHGHTHEAGANAADTHARHCHGDSASCSDVPATAGVSFGLANEALALTLAAGALLAVASANRAALRENVLAPDRRPPRPFLSPA